MHFVVAFYLFTNSFGKAIFVNNCKSEALIPSIKHLHGIKLRRRKKTPRICVSKPPR